MACGTRGILRRGRAVGIGGTFATAAAGWVPAIPTAYDNRISIVEPVAATVAARGIDMASGRMRHQRADCGTIGNVQAGQIRFNGAARFHARIARATLASMASNSSLQRGHALSRADWPAYTSGFVMPPGFRGAARFHARIA